jgi:hypothetical protein
MTAPERMPLSFTEDRLVVPDRVVTRTVQGATVLLNLATGSSFLLDGIGTRAWAALTSAPSIQDAYDSLLAEYQVEPEQLKGDLETLVASLESQGLLEVVRG